MPIKRIKCWVLVCKECGKMYDPQDMGEIHFQTKDDAKEELVDNDLDWEKEGLENAITELCGCKYKEVK